jgi:hypothetical protein
MRCFFKKAFLFAALIPGILLLKAQTDIISVHDPVIIWQDSIYYILCTGNDIYEAIKTGFAWPVKQISKL